MWVVDTERAVAKYDGVMVRFSGEQVEVRGYVELRTTFTDGTLA